MPRKPDWQSTAGRAGPFEPFINGVRRNMRRQLYWNGATDMKILLALAILTVAIVGGVGATAMFGMDSVLACEDGSCN
jgi:hypothetical protein